LSANVEVSGKLRVKFVIGVAMGVLVAPHGEQIQVERTVGDGERERASNDPGPSSFFTGIRARHTITSLKRKCIEATSAYHFKGHI